MTSNPTSAELAVIEKGASLPEVLRVISRSATLVPADQRPADLPKLVLLGEDAQKAMDALRSTNLVQVDTRRSLTADEVNALLTERASLDALEAFVKARKEAHRSMVFNHLDIEVDGNPPADADLDDKGHWLVPGSLTVPGAAKKFTREIRQGSPSLTAEALAEVEDGETFTHEDYLACTTQVRVVDEAKVLLHLRTRPQIVDAIRKATSVGQTTASVYVRKA